LLAHLSIRDLVLIEQVDLDLAAGLTVLTGETGAGKSILLDGLGLSLGDRAEATMVRKGATQASVTAEFRIDPMHPACLFLDENAISLEDRGHIIVRRILRADGGSRAFINDQPVAVGTLRMLGALLVEIHGQHDERGLLNPRGHMALLDVYAGHDALLADTAAAWQRLADARQALAGAAARAEADSRDREWLEHAVAELQALNPEAGEEAELAETRSRMQKGARLIDSLGQVEELVSGADGAMSALRQAARWLERIADEAPELAAALEAIDRALVEGDTIESGLADVRDRMLVSPEALEHAEARLFELRGMARKHRVEVEALPKLAADLAQRLETIADSGAALKQLARVVQDAARVLDETAARLRESRKNAAARLDAAVNAELPALKLENARFRTDIQPGEPMVTGADRVNFEIATNKGQDFGPLTRIASGGELSRFILALKVALASTGTAGTLVFDEIDRGVGGAVASAIGERLARLTHSADGAQLLVVTHSPQVAAAGAAHLLIAKADGGGGTRSSVRLLQGDDRIEEVARMLSGAAITAEARAQAARLIAGI